MKRNGAWIALMLVVINVVNSIGINKHIVSTTSYIMLLNENYALTCDVISLCDFSNMYMFVYQDLPVYHSVLL